MSRALRSQELWLTLGYLGLLLLMAKGQELWLTLGYLGLLLLMAKGFAA